MAKEFHNIKKYCEDCGKLLILNNTRDIIRKRFCSGKCMAKFLWKEKIFHGIPCTEIQKEKMRQSKLELIRNGWKPIGWLKYLPKIRLSGRGYYFIGHQREHQFLMEKEIGRKLLKNEVVHHIDANKLNNALENLCLMTRSEHIKLHLRERRERYVTSGV